MRALFKEPRARRASDFYPTRDPAVIPALDMSGALGDWPVEIWEPACGEGDMSCALEARGYRVTSTDLLDEYNYGLGGLDFLAFKRPIAPSIITNPPFGLADEFIAHARGALEIQFLALLLKVDFFSAASRLDGWEKDPPKWILPLTWRVDFTGYGSPPMNCMWVVWTPGQHEGTKTRPLRKPKL